MKFLYLFLLFSISSFSQVFVGETNINESASTLEVWAVKKPFSDKESFFADYGQDKFKLHNYDTKAQSIYNKEMVKFEKGKWINLSDYLTAEGWELKSERPTTIGEQQGRIITFTRKKA